MGTHIQELRGSLSLDIIMQYSAWRPVETISLPLRGIYSFFQDEQAIIRGWFDTDVIITHTKNYVTVELPHQILRVGGLDGS